jgi:type IV pilus assembly protein PilB
MSKLVTRRARARDAGNSTAPQTEPSNGAHPDLREPDLKQPDVKQPDPEQPDRELRLLARRLGYRFVDDLADYPVDPEAWELVPHSIINRHKVVPLGFSGEVLVVAVADPANVIALDDLRTTTGRDLEVLVARRHEVEEVIRRLDRLDRSAETLLEEAAEISEEDEARDEIRTDDAPIVKAINRIITRAVQQRASDIHIEPQQRDVRIRFRIDGVLSDAMHTRRTLHAGIVSRLKVMADLDIAEKRVPQDGRITVNVERRSVDLRMATLPTSWGEKVVLRILDHGTGVVHLEELGFGDPALPLYREVVMRPHGCVLITGPTGSGKTTTLYATLESINDPTKNIVTVEDPVEARIAGLSQIHVNPKAGLSFATALRSILRTDPDVVMVGEMRDRETAVIGVEAALTGHLVLSTLHTNDAASAMTRLTEMGVEPFLVASALECVVAQRLARRLCPKCAETYTPRPEFLEPIGFPWSRGDKLPKLRRAVGCSSCAGTGYYGRVAIVEAMRVSDEVQRLTVSRASAEDIKRLAIAEGMRPLRQDGLRKALEGTTSVEEVLRVVV